MVHILDWLNKYNGLITALATVALTVLTYFLKELGKQQALAAEKSAEAAASLKELEVRRSAAEDPWINLFFEGYGQGNSASFVLQNSGKQKLFLRSMRVVIPGDTAGSLRASNPVDNATLAQSEHDELTNLTIPTDNPIRVTFSARSTSGSHFELLLQLYTGEPRRLRIDPAILNGYVIKSPGSSRLEIESKAPQQ